MSDRPRFPKVEADYYPMAGGLNLVQPAISIKPGQLIDAQNYEPNAVGGYRRINGFERSDGRTSPTSAGYSVIAIALSGSIANGVTVTGATSGATGIALGLYDSNATLVLGRVSGAFVSGEALQVAGVTQATSTGPSLPNGATSASDHADYKLLAANDRRADIGVVPGSGPVRGVFVFNDVVYAFRDNAGGTAGALYKQTASGWSLVAFGKEIQFTAATGQINAGDTVTGGTSGATGVVVRSLLRTGTWSASGVGTLVLSGVTGTFQNGEALKVAAVSMATSASLCTNITRAAGGRLESVLGNFSGSTATKYVYGCDGVNFAFEFDGTNYIPIRTGMAVDAPLHIAFHKAHLFLSFLGSLQFSGINQPYSWTVLTGAAEIGMGEDITALVPQTGNQSGASLAVFSSGKTSILYGSGSTDFNLIPSVYELGYRPYTVQPVSNNTYGLTARGVQSLITTLNYGDFQFAALSFLVQPLLVTKAGLEIASVSLKAKNQYRIYFTDNTALVFGLTGEKISGITELDYGIPVRCIVNATLSSGEEVTYFGSDSGYVYKDNVGTSFDGDAITSRIRPAFNNLQSPRVRKQYRRAVFEVQCEGYSQVNATYDLGYGSGSIEQAAPQDDQTLMGAGGYWDALTFQWDHFTWDAPVVSDAEISIDGTATNIGFLFRSSRAQDDAHVIQGVSLLYTERRLVRSGS